MTGRLPELRISAINGQKIAWREAGSGPALLLLHGIGGYSASWRAQFVQFSGSHRVIAWDAPGYGGSSPLQSNEPAVEDYTRKLDHLCAELDVSSASAVGHSLGGVMLAGLIRLNPSLIECAVFLQTVAGSGALGAEERETVRQARLADLNTLGMAKFAELRGKTILGGKASVDAVDEALDVMRAVPEAGYRTAWNMMCAVDIFDHLPHVRCPSLVVCGSNDPVAPPAVGRKIQSAIADCRYEELSEVGHYASIEAPDRLLLLLRQFLDPTRTNAK